MTVDQHELYVADAEGASETPFRRFVRELSPADFLVFGYLVLLNFAVARAPSSATQTTGMLQVLGLLVLHSSTVVLIRTGKLRHPIIAPVLYRVITYGCVQITYFMFSYLLPLINSHAYDHKLYSLDLLLFGVEPAEYFDRFVNPVTTEWFAFFYFGYFLVLAIHVLPILFGSRNVQLLNEFAMGMLLLFCFGHTIYWLVPGYGPYKAMPEIFQHQLSSGVFLNVTNDLVATSGAQKDIFPSLHTAAPVFITLFSFHRRAEFPFRYTWPIVGFFAVNIVIATMFLRWHYVIDVVAGLLLAAVVHALSVRIVARELPRRKAYGLSPAWPSWPS